MTLDTTIVRPYEPDLVARLLHHLGFDDRSQEPTAEELRALHRAFLDRVPYENLEIQLGRRTSIDPVQSAEQILTGRGGYCYHLNGTFGTLLASLGYMVTLVAANPDPNDPDGWGRHVVVLVDVPDQTLIADVGLGDGPRDPVPLVPGRHRQDPFDYGIEHLGGLRWWFAHDTLGTLGGFEMNVRPLPLAAFAAQHHVQSTSASSSFVQKFTVQMRRADHTSILRGCVHTRVDAAGKHVTEVAKEADWWDLLTDEFGLGLGLDGLDSAARAALWRRVRNAHEAWLRSQPG